MQVIQFNPAASSQNKGESLYDTCLTFDALGVDILVIRSSQTGYYSDLVNHASLNCHIINGGDGSGQHPSQCLLDLMTIAETFASFKGLKVAIAGDIAHSRVARSNAMVLNALGAQVYFCGPEAWYDESFERYGTYHDLDEVIGSLDVLMLLRIQHERHGFAVSFSKEDYHRCYGLTLERYGKLTKTAIIMHPAPVNRDVEIADDLVESNQSRIVEQMRNGVYMRMAILEWIMEENNDNID